MVCYRCLNKLIELDPRYLVGLWLTVCNDRRFRFRLRPFSFSDDQLVPMVSVFHELYHDARSPREVYNDERRLILELGPRYSDLLYYVYGLSVRYD